MKILIDGIELVRVSWADMENLRKKELYGVPTTYAVYYPGIIKIWPYPELEKPHAPPD